ncbi:ferric reductase-like transmembrane domain-containing protein [Georgenia sp. M64]|uniref:ferric reductase-like transmembrane domain-containing protein n=1 Tax=Georgenia sp. M64 TaxID=3120520 RepID=UPI0030DFF2C8
MSTEHVRRNVVDPDAGPTLRDSPQAAAAWRSASVRHSVLAVATLVLVFAFWRSRMEWTPDMRLWRALGDAAVVLLFASLAMGPAARLSAVAARALSWRRQVGVWAALAAFAHSLLTIDGWARWSVRRFLGYEFVPELGREVRLEPGFGLANLIGLVAAGWLLVLLATSSDRAVRWLGPRGWKWLHGGSHVVFYLVVLHAGYFLFMHYTASFHRAVPAENWFRFPMLVLAAMVLVLKWAAFTRTIRRSRARAAGPARMDRRR